ncbi:hypothetical protein OROHE_007100 [Orobanche hederae]
MITISKISFQPTISNAKPTSNFQFPGVVVNFHPEFSRRSSNRAFHRLCWAADRGEMDFIRKFSKGCFKGLISNKERNVEIEPASGGEDIFDAAAAETRVQPDHLVIMVNGIIGR